MRAAGTSSSTTRASSWTGIAPSPRARRSPTRRRWETRAPRPSTSRRSSPPNHGSFATGPAQAGLVSLMVGDVPVLGCDRKALVVPERQAAAQRPRVPSGGAKRLRGHGRARAQPAGEDDRAVALDRLGLGGEPLELDVARALDAPGLPLVGLADV